MSKVAKYKAAASAGLTGRAQDELVRTHAPLVKRIAYHLMSRLPPAVQIDDLIQSGMIGLLEAARLIPGTLRAAPDSLPLTVIGGFGRSFVTIFAANSETPNGM